MGILYSVLSICELMYVEYLTDPIHNMLISGQHCDDYGYSTWGGFREPLCSCLEGGHRLFHPLDLKAQISVLIAIMLWTLSSILWPPIVTVDLTQSLPLSPEGVQSRAGHSTFKYAFPRNCVNTGQRFPVYQSKPF